jgi:hypothetical protein
MIKLKDDTDIMPLISLLIVLNSSFVSGIVDSGRFVKKDPGKQPQLRLSDLLSVPFIYPMNGLQTLLVDIVARYKSDLPSLLNALAAKKKELDVCVDADLLMNR